MATSDYISPRWVEEGMSIIAPYNDKGIGIKCNVTVATGDHARVVNQKYGFDHWFPLHALRVKLDDRHAK